MSDTNAAAPLGLSGRIARTFLDTQITPLLALLGLLLGLFAVLVTPKEEEPQINVTMANVMIAFPGASSDDVHNLVTVPAEQVLSQITGIEHVFSVTRPGLAVLTIQFKVGQDRIASLVRLHDTLQANADWLPQHLGVQPPIVKPRGIDDVPIVALTLHGRGEPQAASDLERVAHALEIELKRVPGARGDHARRPRSGGAGHARPGPDGRAADHGCRHRARVARHRRSRTGRSAHERQSRDRRAGRRVLPERG